MTIPVLFEKFMRGESLPDLATSAARALLDLARDKLLSRGIKTAAPSDTGPGGIKKALLDAHRQLTGGGVYAQAGKDSPLAGLSDTTIASIVAEHKATGRSYLELIAAAKGHKPTASARPAAKPAAAGGRPAAPAARPATTRSAQKASDMMARRAAAAKPAAAAPPRPLADASTGHLAMLISHPSATAADRAAATAEAALRPGVTIHSDGRTSVSSRGGRAVKNARKA